MDAPTFAEAAEKSSTANSAAEVGNSNSAEQKTSKAPSKIQYDAERIKSSIARITSSSIKELEGLTSELRELQEFLNTETERVQHDIDSALAGLKIIIDTISPWRGNPVSNEALNGVRGFRRAG